MFDDLDLGCDLEQICRDDRCDLDWVHPSHEILDVDSRAKRTRIRRWRDQPWRLNCVDALRDSVLTGVSSIEPRNFATVYSFVENDYGSCCPRSVHRHLASLKAGGQIVRLDFRGNVHAYLRAGSRLIRDPDLVMEQVAMLFGEVA
jgi:hypothetical protein